MDRRRAKRAEVGAVRDGHVCPDGRYMDETLGVEELVTRASFLSLDMDHTSYVSRNPY